MSSHCWVSMKGNQQTKRVQEPQPPQCGNRRCTEHTGEAYPTSTHRTERLNTARGRGGMYAGTAAQEKQTMLPPLSENLNLYTVFVDGWPDQPAETPNGGWIISKHPQ